MKTSDKEASHHLLTEKEAAQYLSVCVRTLWSWRKQGRMPHIRFSTSVRYKKDDLDEFIQTHRMTP